MTITRHCKKCGQLYDLDDQEIADGSYSPLCTECLRQSCEAEQPSEPVPELPIGELN
jgi:hypothetical protein